MKIEPGMRFGKLTVISKADGYKWNCVCDCGNATTPTEHNLLAGKSTSCGNCGRNYYRDMDDGVSVEIITTNGIPVYIDKIDEDKVRKYKWSVSVDKKGFATAVTASFGSVEHLFRYLWNIFFGITEHLIRINGTLI